MHRIKKHILLLPFLLTIACMESSGPSATENTLAGAVNLDELFSVSAGDISVYLVEFESGGSMRVDSTQPDYSGEYEFSGFDFGTYGVEAETSPGSTRHYYGFRDADRDGYFDIDDAITFSNYNYIPAFNVPMFERGTLPDTNETEFEPNDNAITAQDFDIIHAVHISGNISSGGFEPPNNYTGDLDLYKFESVWTGYLTIRLDWSESANLDIFLYDRDGIDVLEQSVSDGGGPEILYHSVYRYDEFIVLVASADYSAYYELSIRIE